MLSRPAPLPSRGGYSYEVKWDGFRAMVSTTDGLRVRSRRGWNMTELVPGLADLPPRLVLDGELVAWGEDGLPSFPLLCDRMLHRRPGIAITYMVFDVLEHVGKTTMHMRYWQRRRLLDRLDLNGSHWRTPEAFDDGEALFESVKIEGLEGVVAKKLSQPYRPGERLWLKTKNRDYWRYPSEVDAAQRKWRSAASTFGTV